MLKKKIIIISIISVSLLLFWGCNKEVANDNNVQNKSESNGGTPMFDLLTEEQKNYLTEEQYFTKDRINKMDYEAINWELLGTGFELYNQSSGVEKFGLSYEDTEPISQKSDSEDLITMRKVIEIRKKEKEMRLNDFSEYKYEIEQYGEKYGMYIPVADYENTFVVISYTKDDAGSIHMQVPFIKHDRKGSSDCVFSILYDAESLRQYMEEEPKYETSGKKYIEVQHTSVTEDSMVLELWNCTEKAYKLVTSYELYEITDSGEKLIDASDGEKKDMRENSYSIEGVKFSEDVKLEEGKKYLIKFGKDTWGHFYDEVEFSR